MRHVERGPEVRATAALRELAVYLERSGSSLSPDEALASAVREWIAAREAGEVARDPGAFHRRPGGYQWKCLFLGHGSELRVYHEGRYHYAEVSQDVLMYGARQVSPRQFVLAVMGDPRNAWRELWVRRPSDARWKLASVLQRELEAGKPPPESPVGAMREVAAAMAQTLETAQAIVKGAQQFVEPKFERRGRGLRRADDVLADDYQQD